MSGIFEQIIKAGTEEILDRIEVASAVVRHLYDELENKTRLNIVTFKREHRSINAVKAEWEISELKERIEENNRNIKVAVNSNKRIREEILNRELYIKGLKENSVEEERQALALYKEWLCNNIADIEKLEELTDEGFKEMMDIAYRHEGYAILEEKLDGILRELDNQ